MDWVTIKRIFRAGFLDFWRNAFVSFASILVMTVTLFTVGLAIFTGVVLNFTLSDLQNKADINVYFIQNAPEDQISSLQKQLEALPEVANVQYESADDALAQFRERHADDQLTLQALDELGTNPFGAVLNVKAKNISQYDAIANFLNQQATVSTGAPSIIDKIDYFDEQHQEALTNLEQIINVSTWVGRILLLLFIALALIICFNTMRLAIYNSRDEIHVMRLVGAGAFYIRAPFMVEGVMYGAISGILTLLLFYPLTLWLGQATSNFFGGVNVFSYYLSHFILFFFAIVGTGVVLGGAAAYLAVRRYLKI